MNKTTFDQKIDNAAFLLVELYLNNILNSDTFLDVLLLVN